MPFGCTPRTPLTKIARFVKVPVTDPVKVPIKDSVIPGQLDVADDVFAMLKIVPKVAPHCPKWTFIG